MEIKHAITKKPKEVEYVERGYVVTISGTHYLIAQIEPNTISLVSLYDGNRYTEPIELSDEDFTDLCSGKLTLDTLATYVAEHTTLHETKRMELIKPENIQVVIKEEI